jgi:hypothetical protein
MQLTRTQKGHQLRQWRPCKRPVTEEEGVGLQNLFQEPVRNAAGCGDRSRKSRSNPVGDLLACDNEE